MKGTLLDKERFKLWKKEKEEMLKNLTIKEAVRRTQNLLSIELPEIMKRNLKEDEPKSLIYTLKNAKRNI